MRAGLRWLSLLSILCRAPLVEAASGPAASPAALHAAPTPTVLYPLRSLGISAEAAAALDATLRNEVGALPEVSLIGAQAIAASLEAEHDPDCLQRLACAASAASRAGARQLVSGTVSGLGDAVLVDLKLVDARSGEALRRVTHPITGKQDLLIETLHAAAVELLAPARFTGRLDVQLVQSGEGAQPTPAPAKDAAGTSLFIDGKRVATLPLLAPIDGVAPGKRALRVSKEGFRDASLFVEIRFERTTQAYIDLPHGELTGVAFLRADEPAKKAPEAAIAPPIQATAPIVSTIAAPTIEQRGPWMKIAGWSALGLSAASLVVGIAVHIKAYQTSSGLNSRNANYALGPGDVSLYSDVNTEVDAARVLYVLGGLLGAGGGALLLWDHHLDQGRMVVSALPIVTGSGGGVGATGRF